MRSTSQGKRRTNVQTESAPTRLQARDHRQGTQDGYYSKNEAGQGKKWAARLFNLVFGCHV